VKIVLLIDSLHSIAAGSERQIYKLAEGLTSAGHNVRLILLRHSSFTSNPVDFPCAIECLNIHSIASVDAVKKMLALRKQLVSKKIDVIHAYFPDSCLLAPLFLKTKENRIVTSRRDMGLMYLGKPAWLYRSLSFRTDAVVSNSLAVANFVEGKEKLNKSQKVVIYNGMENYTVPQQDLLKIFTRENSTRIIFVANIKPIKRNLDAVRAAGQLIASGNDIELALIGEHQDKEYTAEIQNFITAEHLESHIRLLGPITEPRQFLHQANIGLLVSESEGLSNTIMEYMQAGMPVVATDVGGNAELVTHQKNGLLVEKGNISQLINAILLLSKDERLRVLMGATGAKKITDEFSIAALVAQHEKAYRKNTKAPA
jgi:L-malate glycosyltransferase